MPEQMIAHWGINGQADGSMGKAVVLALFPAIMSLLALLFFAIPRMDPLKKNIAEFRRYFDFFIILLFLFFIALQIVTISWNLGVMIPIIPVISIGIGLLFFAAGIMSEHAKKNWFIGFRTPWTMSSDVVWEKTHRLGGRMFQASGLIAIIGAVVPEYAFFLILGPVIGSSVYVTYYSYREYQKEEKK
jgi:uncharacterized membrane protein